MSDTTMFTGKKFAKLLKRNRWNPDGRCIAEAIANVAHPKSALDLGCGTGRVIGALFDYCGCTDVVGVEGSPGVRKHLYPSIASNVVCKDVTKAFTLPHDLFDLVICTEVAEHIEQPYSAALVSNICNHSGNFVLFSAAPPGQKGTGHINCQKWKFWGDLFTNQGFAVDDTATKQYKAAIKKCGVLSIYVVNGVVLRKN